MKGGGEWYQLRACTCSEIWAKVVLWKFFFSRIASGLMADLTVSLTALSRKQARKAWGRDIRKCTLCVQKCIMSLFERGDSLVRVSEERFWEKVEASRLLHLDPITRPMLTKTIICSSFSMDGRLPINLPLNSPNDAWTASLSFRIPLQGEQTWETCHSKRTPRRLSEKRNTFCLLQLFIVYKYLLHWSWKKFQTSVGRWKVRQKSSQRARRMRTNQQVHGVCSSLRCSSTSPCRLQTSKLPQRVRLLSSPKIDFQTTLSSRSQLESSTGKSSLPAQQSRHQDKSCVQLYYMERWWREAQLLRAKTTTFSTELRFFKGSTALLVSQPHARENGHGMATLRQP